MIYCDFSCDDNDAFIADVMHDENLKPNSKLVALQLIYDFIETGGDKPVRVYDLSERLHISPNAVYSALRQLVSFDFIKVNLKAKKVLLNKTCSMLEA